MGDIFYNMGSALFYAIPAVIAVYCITKIRKNRAEIKRLEGKQNKKK